MQADSLIFIGSTHGVFSLANMRFLSGGNVQSQCNNAIVESFVFMLAAFVFMNTSLLSWDRVKMIAGGTYLNLFCSCMMSCSLTLRIVPNLIVLRSLMSLCTVV